MGRKRIRKAECCWSCSVFVSVTYVDALDQMKFASTRAYCALLVAPYERQLRVQDKAGTDSTWNERQINRDIAE